MRVVSLLIGLCALPAVWMTARTLWPESRWRPAVTLAVFAGLPMTPYMTAMLNNSTLAMTLISLIVWLCAHLAMGASDRRTWLGLGACLGLLLLTKVTGSWTLVLIGLTGYIAIRKTPRDAARATMVNALLSAGLVVLIAGPWLARNQAVYGTMLPERVSDRRGNEGGFIGFLAYPEDAWMAFTAGWKQTLATLYMPYWLIQPYARELWLREAAMVLAALTAAGLAVGVARKAVARKTGAWGRRDAYMASVVAAMGVAGVMVVYMSVRDYLIVVSGGRYLWEGVSAASVLGCAGLTAYRRRWVCGAISVSVIAGLVYLSVRSWGVVTWLAATHPPEL